MGDIKVGEGKTSIEGSLDISQFVSGIISKHVIKFLWFFIGGVSIFLVTQLLGLSTIVYEINGKQQHVDKTVETLLHERQAVFSTMLNMQKNLIDENAKLKEQINLLSQPTK